MADDVVVMPSAQQKTASASSSLFFGAESLGPSCSLSTLRSPGRPGPRKTRLRALARRPPGLKPGGSLRGLLHSLLSSCFLLPGFA